MRTDDSGYMYVVGALARACNRDDGLGLQALRVLLTDVCLRLHGENTGVDKMLKYCQTLIDKPQKEGETDGDSC